MLPNYNYDPSVYCLFIDDSPLPIGGDIIYVLICSSTDPESDEPLQTASLVLPLQLSIWMTAEDGSLHIGLL